MKLDEDQKADEELQAQEDQSLARADLAAGDGAVGGPRHPGVVVPVGQVVDRAAGAAHDQGADREERGQPPVRRRSLPHGREGQAPPAGEEQQPGADRPVEADQPQIGSRRRRRDPQRPMVGADVARVVSRVAGGDRRFPGRAHALVLNPARQKTRRCGVTDEAERIATRLYVEAELGEGAAVGLDHARAHYLRSVLRLARGARLALFNGRDGEWSARIDAIGKGWASLVVESRRRAQDAGPDIRLLFAPIKRARLDFLAEKAVELGVSALQPVFTRHCIVKRVNLERLRATAREAAEQCERLTLPEVQEARPLFDVMADWPPERRLLVCAEQGEPQPIGRLLAAAGTDPSARAAAWAILTGPEGGFARSELDGLMKLPFVTPVGLGPRVLRADTAALAALASWQALLGDGHRRPPFRDF
jgi:16S rRNA (uracil1498-N3)-methyltransferase